MMFVRCLKVIEDNAKEVGLIIDNRKTQYRITAVNNPLILLDLEIDDRTFKAGSTLVPSKYYCIN